MTYCVAIRTDAGLCFVSDSRTNAGVDNVSTYSKMFCFEAPGQRQLVVLSSGNLATTQGVIAQIKKEAFVEKARKIHGSKYGYENVVYINNKMKVSIICATHGEFLQSPSNHVNHTQGCPHCRVVERAGKTSIGNQEFLKRAK
mgnify:CR=1 FL=1